LYPPECVEGLSGKSERTPFWGPKSLQKGVKRHLINALRYRNNALTDPSGHFPNSLWKGGSQKLACACKPVATPKQQHAIVGMRLPAVAGTMLASGRATDEVET